MSDLFDPYQFEFFRNGVLLATLAGALCGLMGVYVVQRGMSYIGHGLPHALFGGFAASALLGVNLIAGAGAWGVASALMINRVARRRGIAADAAIGVVTTASFALGLLILNLGTPTRVDVDAALFGSILGVTATDLWLVVGVGVVSVGFVLLRYRELLFATFDAEVAEVSGVDVGRLDMVFMTLLAATLLATLNVMGVTLVAAGLVIPAVTARLMTASFPRVLTIATALGAVSGFAGMNVSYHLDVASGPAIVLVATGFFVASLAVATVPLLHPARRSGAAVEGRRVTAT